MTIIKRCVICGKLINWIDDWLYRYSKKEVSKCTKYYDYNGFWASEKVRKCGYLYAHDKCVIEKAKAKVEGTSW